jgi:hypothetical protein
MSSSTTSSTSRTIVPRTLLDIARRSTIVLEYSQEGEVKIPVDLFERIQISNIDESVQYDDVKSFIQFFDALRDEARQKDSEVGQYMYNTFDIYHRYLRTTAEENAPRIFIYLLQQVDRELPRIDGELWNSNGIKRSFIVRFSRRSSTSVSRRIIRILLQHTDPNEIFSLSYPRRSLVSDTIVDLYGSQLIQHVNNKVQTGQIEEILGFLYNPSFLSDFLNTTSNTAEFRTVISRLIEYLTINEQRPPRLLVEIINFDLDQNLPIFLRASVENGEIYYVRYLLDKFLDYFSLELLESLYDYTLDQEGNEEISTLLSDSIYLLSSID